MGRPAAAGGDTLAREQEHTMYGKKAESNKGSEDPATVAAKSNAEASKDAEISKTSAKSEDSNKNKDTGAEGGPSSEHHGDSDALETVLMHVGEFGRYQKFLFLAMFPFGATFAFVYLVQMFVVATPKSYWCKVPELMEAVSDPKVRRSLTAPQISKDKWEQCAMFDVDYKHVLSSLEPPAKGTPTVPCRHGWEFELTDIPYETVVSERGWVCKKASYGTIAQTVFFLGSALGGFLSGYMADQYGRVPALIASNMIGLVGSVCTIYTRGLVDFAICRFIAGMAFDNCFIMMYILVLEYVGPSHRTMVANMSVAIFFGGSCVALPWLAYFIRNWRALMWVTSIPFLAAFVAPFVVPESARWLASRGRIENAVDILRKFERVNGTKIPKEAMDAFIRSSRVIRHDETLISLCKSPLLRLMLLFMVLVYGTGAVVYDGLVRLSESLGLDFFITFTLTAATEIPANAAIAFFLDKFGRRVFTYVPMFVAGLLSLVGAFVPRGIPVVALAIIARFTVIMGFNAATQWTTELLPTGVRASGSSLVHISGYIATVVSPSIVYSERIWTPLPLLSLAIISMVGGAIAILLPETRGLAMPQTIVEGEELSKEHSLLGKRARAKEKKAIAERERTSPAITIA